MVNLHRALDQLEDRAGKQRSVVLLDLAAAHATTDAEYGLDLAAQAFNQLEREPSQARVLDERVRSLPAAG